jgi:signal peptidase I
MFGKYMKIIKTNQMKPIVREVLFTLVMALLFYGIFNLVLETRGIGQTSMEPTIEPGERFVVSKISYRLHDPERGDIIILHSPYDPTGIPNIKRIIGLPGETIDIKNGTVLINGRILEEPYLVQPTTGTTTALHIPAGNYFVMGDHRSVSLDSRSWGLLPRENIMGKTIWRYWPLSRFGPSPNEKPVLATAQ